MNLKLKVHGKIEGISFEVKLEYDPFDVPMNVHKGAHLVVSHAAKAMISGIFPHYLESANAMYAPLTMTINEGAPLGGSSGSKPEDLGSNPSTLANPKGTSICKHCGHTYGWHWDQPDKPATYVCHHVGCACNGFIG